MGTFRIALPVASRVVSENYERLLGILNDIQYKKGCRVGIHVSGDLTYLHVNMVVTDVLTGVETQVTMYEPFPPEIRREELIRLVYVKLVHLETHEASEWFHYRGQAIYNEHEIGQAHGIMGTYDPTKDVPVVGPWFKPPTPPPVKEFELKDIEFTADMEDEPIKKKKRERTKT